MTSLSLVGHQFRYEQKVFWRRPASVFFTVLLPLIFLFIFTGIFGNERIDALGVTVAQYYVPGIITLALVSATLVSLAISLTEARESGQLKRLRGTPAPAWVLISGRVGNAVVVSLLMVTVTSAIGILLYDVELRAGAVPAVLLAVAVGAFTFSCLGFALSAAIPSVDAAPAITNVTVLPLYFLSGVFIPQSEIPEGVLRIADAFPIRHLFVALFDAFDPAAAGGTVAWGNLLVLWAWGVAALLLAVRYFRWAPR